jgi:hypothetical protein
MRGIVISNRSQDSYVKDGVELWPNFPFSDLHNVA